ncbi:MAG: von Willebrand factor type A domain-containing protein [Flavobacteriales bacterium]|nr:von Willebrand factor type A domain-containing protein [Flavobacteriales bacterium]
MKTITLIAGSLAIISGIFFNSPLSEKEPIIKPGELQGFVKDKSTNEAIPFVNVVLVDSAGGQFGASSDFNGKYRIQHLTKGTYTLRARFIGYQALEIQNVVINSAKITYLDIKLSASAIEMQEFEVVEESRSELSVRKLKTAAYSVVSGNRVGNVSYDWDDSYMANESYSEISENEFKHSLKDPLSTFSIDVDAASYSNVRRMINQGYAPQKNAVRVEEMINYFSYDYPNPKGNDPFSITTEVSDCPWNEQHKLVHIGLQGKKIETENLPPSNLVFLIDVSGSMSNYNKLPLLKKSFALLVDQLRPQDRVAIIVYAGAAGCVLESTSGNEKGKILGALENLQSGGSTAGGAGINLAYKIALNNFLEGGNNRVILATDGDFNVGASSDNAMEKLIEEKRKSGVFLTVLGFGMGNYKDSKMEVIADKGNGNYAYIDNIMEAKKVFVNELGATLFTIAKDVKIQVEFNPSKVAYYKLIGYENRMLAAEDFNDDTKDAGELGAGHTVTALYEIVPVGVKSNIVPSIDPLKYQKVKESKIVVDSDELLTVKFRYKDPKGTTSKLIVKELHDKSVKLANASDNFKYSAAVTEFGLLLRDSKYKASSNYSHVVELAKSAKGNDVYGYRTEFIRLAETMELLADK